VFAHAEQRAVEVRIAHIPGGVAPLEHGAVVLLCTAAADARPSAIIMRWQRPTGNDGDDGLQSSNRQPEGGETQEAAAGS